MHGIDFELQHLGGFSAVVAAFALQGDAADFQVAGFREFDRAVAVELDRVGRGANDPFVFFGRLALAIDHSLGYLTTTFRIASEFLRVQDSLGSTAI